MKYLMVMMMTTTTVKKMKKAGKKETKLKSLSAKLKEEEDMLLKRLPVHHPQKG
jgi:hypothetical protein